MLVGGGTAACRQEGGGDICSQFPDRFYIIIVQLEITMFINKSSSTSLHLKKKKTFYEQEFSSHAIKI